MNQAPKNTASNVLQKFSSLFRDNCVFRMALQQYTRRRMLPQLFAPTALLYAIAFTIIRVYYTLASTPFPYPASQLLHLITLGLFFINLLGTFIYDTYHDPLGKAWSTQTVEQFIVTGLSPVRWITGSISAIATDSLLIVALHLPLFCINLLMGGLDIATVLITIMTTLFAALSLLLIILSFFRSRKTAIISFVILIFAYGITAVALLDIDSFRTWSTPETMTFLSVCPIIPILSAMGLPSAVQPMLTPCAIWSWESGCITMFFLLNSALIIFLMGFILTGERLSKLPRSNTDTSKNRRNDHTVGETARKFVHAFVPNRINSLYRLFQENNQRLFIDSRELFSTMLETGAWIIVFLLGFNVLVSPINEEALPLYISIILLAPLLAVFIAGSALCVRPGVLTNDFGEAPLWSQGLPFATKAFVVLITGVFVEHWFRAASIPSTFQLPFAYVSLLVLCLTLTTFCTLIFSALMKESVNVMIIFFTLCTLYLGLPPLAAFVAFWVLPLPSPLLNGIANISPGFLALAAQFEPLELSRAFDYGELVNQEVSWKSMPIVFSIVNAVFLLGFVGLTFQHMRSEK